MTKLLVYESPTKQRSAPLDADNLRARTVLEGAGWKVVEEFDTDAVTETVEMPAAETPSNWDELPLTTAQWKSLVDAGYADEAALNAATDAKLQAVQGIGAATVRNIRKALKA